MGKVVVRSFGVSLDGFAAGPDQSLEHPLGVRGPEIMEWVFPTRFFQRMHGDPQGEGGETGIDNEMAERSFAGVGAWILGRNMFGPVRGPWLDDQRHEDPRPGSAGEFVAGCGGRFKRWLHLLR